MARPLRIEFPGAIYHVSCRMVGDWKRARALLFRDDSDRERFLEQLAERVGQYSIRLYLFVLMGNHFHLVFETPEGNCSKFMQSLSTAYTVYFNLRHGRHGHVFDGRYKAKLVEGDEYLLALSRYVHLNPVQIRELKNQPIQERIKHLRSYRWSSYLSYIGRRKRLDFVEYGPVLGEMSGRKSERPKRYRAFVERGLAETDDDFVELLGLSPRSIGGDGFRAWVEDLHRGRVEECARPEDVAFRHTSEPLSREDVLAVLGEVFGVEIQAFSQRQYNSPLRAVASKLLIRYAGLGQREVADLLGIGSGSAVNKQIATLSKRLADSRDLRGQVKDAEAQLEARRRAQQRPGRGTR